MYNYFYIYLNQYKKSIIREMRIYLFFYMQSISRWLSFNLKVQYNFGWLWKQIW